MPNEEVSESGMVLHDVLASSRGSVRGCFDVGSSGQTFLGRKRLRVSEKLRGLHSVGVRIGEITWC